MFVNITEQLIEDAKLASVISITVDEFCSISDISQISFYVRFISPDGRKEELLGLLQLMSQTRGEDTAVIGCMNKYNSPLDKIVWISTVGAKSITGIRKEFAAIYNNKKKKD